MISDVLCPRSYVLGRFGRWYKLFLDNVVHSQDTGVLPVRRENWVNVLWKGSGSCVIKPDFCV
jgi:hypothetical protein